MTNALVTIIRAEGPLALYKGLVPTLAGIAPYAALNFALYDLAKARFYEGGKPQGIAANLLLGACTGTVAATVCYPLDTIRRRMQMQGKTYSSQWHAITTILAKARRLCAESCYCIIRY
jgi:solute carrier family 25 (mitochondrial phosphate transporter), member 23/24/25/41